ncbi:hypothetical protein SPI_08004 [Niveomyces insectorum RCEF 264]|uniref:Ima1 N-terminal domain-containing protein n=1 Tax=Niveomyces insectorum RCEF 264 TaxID=1081102 RepID=A0A167NQ64_9HYPO|nr:hypothetical protein SPI_08004 [Niveomyces insectorum RCEF 264]
MPRLGRSRYLTCFYCSRRTSTRNDGHVRQFACPNCAATNYLDGNGDITDPPTSTTAPETDSTTAPLFATAPPSFVRNRAGDGTRAGVSGGADGESVFCATCLKNQHLFVASLAQYFPADPDHPDAPELERKYFRFRQNLEQRYPQVCAQCEPRVLARLQAAAYTAKTDHLRRMVDYSRRVRLARPTYLDAADRLGRWLWWAGLLLQFFWQAGVLGRIVAAVGDGTAAATLGTTSDDDGLDLDIVLGTDDGFVDGVFVNHAAGSGHAAIPWMLQPVLRRLVANADRLQALCVGATVAGCWWNPHFVQTARGFTKPLIGLPTWYAYQATILLVRVALAKLTGLAGEHTDGDGDGDELLPAFPPAAIAGAHIFVAVFVLYLYVSAPRVIRKDLRPLFGKLPTTPLSPRPLPGAAAEDRQSGHQKHRLETMSDVLDEITSTPPSRIQRSGIDHIAGRDGGGPYRTALSNHNADSGYSPQRSRGYDARFRPLRTTADYSSAQPPSSLFKDMDPDDDDAYGSSVDEMDWTPTQPSQSPHRAFNTFEPDVPNAFSRPTATASSVGSFSQMPVEADRGPFWHKVPPAPTSIAQRILNRPNAPRLLPQQQHGASKDGTGTAAFFRRSDETLRTLDLDTRGLASSSSSVEFAQPSFFAEDLRDKARRSGDGNGGGEDDPSSFLSDLFSQTFTLGTGGGATNVENDQGPAHDSMPDRGRRGGLGVHGAATEPSWWRRLAWLAIILTSAGFLHSVQATDQSVDGVDGHAASTIAVDRIRPYLRILETAAAGLCALTAASLTGESARRWSHAVVVRREQRRTKTKTDASIAAPGPSVWVPVFGFLLGLGSVGLAGWMAVQMWRVLPAENGPQSYRAHEISNGDDAHSYPYTSQPEPPVAVWPWWQLAWLHGTVAAHQVWNMCVRGGF